MYHLIWYAVMGYYETGEEYKQNSNTEIFENTLIENMLMRRHVQHHHTLLNSHFGVSMKYEDPLDLDEKKGRQRQV